MKEKIEIGPIHAPHKRERQNKRKQQKREDFRNRSVGKTRRPLRTRTSRGPPETDRREDPPPAADETIGKTSQEELNNLERHETSSPDCREDPPPAGDETVGETSQEELIDNFRRHDDVEPGPSGGLLEKSSSTTSSVTTTSSPDKETSNVRFRLSKATLSLDGDLRAEPSQARR